MNKAELCEWSQEAGPRVRNRPVFSASGEDGDTMDADVPIPPSVQVRLRSLYRRVTCSQEAELRQRNQPKDK